MLNGDFPTHFQNLRRALESIFLTAQSDAQMHIIHYIVGLAFYIGTGLAIVTESEFVGGEGELFLYRPYLLSSPVFCNLVLPPIVCPRIRSPYLKCFAMLASSMSQRHGPTQPSQHGRRAQH